MSAEEGLYDFVVVGAGSAGCVLANRLSEDPRNRVIVLEAGPPDRNIWLKIPAGISRVFRHKTLNWGYFTEPESHLGGRRIYWPRGKTLGGSSAINGMAYIRGQPSDYDHWRQLGNSGWSWDHVLPLFKRGENQQRGADEFHGASGELSVSDPHFRHLASRAFVESARNAGVRSNADFNGADQEGVNFLQFTIRSGVRHSTASAFLDPARRRANLRVETGAHAERIMFDGKRARGIVYRKDGVARTVFGREIVLCGGTINSPQLLMISGIGPASHLRDRSIQPIVDLPGVGENLQDHLYVHVRANVERDYSLNPILRTWRIFPELLRYALVREGPMTLGASQACAFVRSGAHVDRPDLQINFRPVSTNFDSNGKMVPTPYPGVTASVCHLRPQSRGRVSLKSADPYQHPAINADYLQNSDDQRALIAGVRWIRSIFAQSPLRDHIVEETAPGSTIASSDQIGRFIRENAQSMYHPVGTCKMGNDELSVVDEELSVHGTFGLRVVDASIMPSIPSGNTNAPTIMVAEKGADLLLKSR
ncbi:GMC family oxidoreductase [Tardiphaga sp. 215_C5_N2_1]|uniref:GMC family oxidoreductase n=1 Tax=Tardiphaga sp. 215_C5_N2_1 TaxID=3240774 RepID=UPI003F88648B